MKNWVAFTLIAMIFLALAACGNGNSTNSQAANDSADEQKGTSEQEDPSEKEQNEPGRDSKEEDDKMRGSEQRVSVAFDGGEIVVKMDDNPTSRAFLDQLPLTMTFEEYGGFEKLSYPPEELTTEEAPSGHVPARGDFAYYSPWGNVNMYYGDFSYSAGLVKLGEIESGVELLDNIDEDFTVVIKKMD